jgi:hypothetical protein
VLRNSNPNPTLNYNSKINSLQLPTTHSSNNAYRPSSEVLNQHYKSPEAAEIDKWFEDLNYYETTLEQMVQVKLDDAFNQELTAIEQWFSVLSEPERTTALYSLIQHTSQVQLRFFTTVLKQMATRLKPTPSSANSAQRHSSSSASKPEDQTMLPTHPTPAVSTSPRPSSLNNSVNPSFLSPEYKSPQLSHSPLLRPRTPTDDAIDSADWSVGGSPRMMQNLPPTPSPLPPSRQSSRSPQPWGHIDMENLHLNATAGSDYSESDYGASRNGGIMNASIGGAGSNEKGKIPDKVDLSVCNDIPAWFRSLRLHKYTPLFLLYTYNQIILFDDTKLEQLGVAALGARRKMLKVFEMVKGEIEKN